jgi:hypothetical protein
MPWIGGGISLLTSFCKALGEKDSPPLMDPRRDLGSTALLDFDDPRIKNWGKTMP